MYNVDQSKTELAVEGFFEFERNKFYWKKHFSFVQFTARVTFCSTDLLYDQEVEKYIGSSAKILMIALKVLSHITRFGLQSF